MMRPSFLRMRRSLIERGLLTADFQLTEAGRAYADRLMAELRDAPPPEEPDHRVYWRIDFRAKGAELAEARKAA